MSIKEIENLFTADIDKLKEQLEQMTKERDHYKEQCRIAQEEIVRCGAAGVELAKSGMEVELANDRLRNRLIEVSAVMTAADRLILAMDAGKDAPELRKEYAQAKLAASHGNHKPQGTPPQGGG